MQETQPSKDNLLLLFGRSNETMVPVEDIKIQFVEGARAIVWKCREQWQDRGYIMIRVFYSCDGLHIVAEGKQDGERFIPLTSISNLVIDHLPGHKFDKA